MKRVIKNENNNLDSKSIEVRFKSEEMENEDKEVEQSVDLKNQNRKEKNKKSTTFNLIEVVIIMLITVVFGVFIGSCVTYFKKDVSNDSGKYIFDEFISVYDEIVQEYYLDVDEEKMLEHGMKGMLDYLGDPHSSYLNFEETSDLDLNLEGEYVGMGAVIGNSLDGHVYISEMFENSPASRAGFKVGDKIIKVGNEDVTSENSFDVSEKVKGLEGTSIDITVLRDGESITLTLVRGKVEIPSVSSFIIDNVGVVKIDIFAQNTPKQFKDAVDDLSKKGIDLLVIDVRNNTGGYLTSAEEMLGYFLDKNDVMYQLSSKGVVSKQKNVSKKIYDLKVAVLINNYSASASEILAVSLRENIDAVLVGEKTYGKGTVQKGVRLSSGAMIKYTVQEWYGPNGTKVNGVGVLPDFEVVLNKGYVDDNDFGDDNQLKKAIDVLKTK